MNVINRINIQPIRIQYDSIQFDAFSILFDTISICAQYFIVNRDKYSIIKSLIQFNSS